MKELFKFFFSFFGVEVRRRKHRPPGCLAFFKYKTAKRLICFEELFKKISNIDGDIVECGVGKGRSFTMLAYLTALEGKSRTLWGFDSFEGFPEPSIEDKSPRNPRRGEWKKLTQEMVYKLLSETGLDDKFITSNVRVVKGFFKDTMPRCDVEKISFLNLDVDLYDSYKVCLEKLFPRVAKGGVVLFDEYDDAHKFPGAKRAIDEYFQNTPWAILQDNVYGKYYIIKN